MTKNCSPGRFSLDAGVHRAATSASPRADLTRSSSEVSVVPALRALILGSAVRVTGERCVCHARSAVLGRGPGAERDPGQGLAQLPRRLLILCVSWLQPGAVEVSEKGRVLGAQERQGRGLMLGEEGMQDPVSQFAGCPSAPRKQRPTRPGDPRASAGMNRGPVFSVLLRWLKCFCLFN